MWIVAEAVLALEYLKPQTAEYPLFVGNQRYYFSALSVAVAPVDCEIAVLCLYLRPPQSIYYIQGRDVCYKMILKRSKYDRGVYKLYL